MECASSALDRQQRLEKLSFKLIASNKLSLDIWWFLGGSYCSIKGGFTAELTLDATEALSSTNAQGTQVSIWKEGGLLLGLAKTAH